MHRLFLGLLPGGAPAKKSVRQYQVLLATVRPATWPGRPAAGWPRKNWRTCTAWRPSSKR